MNTTIMNKTCNCCGESNWGDMNNRKGVLCRKCGSLERTRVIKLFFDKFSFPKPGMRVLHFAPERSIYRLISSTRDVEYYCMDFSPENFDFAKVKRIELCGDAPKLQTEYYDLIIHSHVMEHIPCNVTAVLYHIHRSLKKGGLHLMCLPFMSGYTAEDLSPLSPEEALKRFGQNDHVRRFGKTDYMRSIGMVFKISHKYSLYDYFPKGDLDQYNIPETERNGVTGSSVFPLRKEDLLLA